MLAVRLVRLERARLAVVIRLEVVIPVLRFTIKVSVTFNKALVYNNTTVIEGDLLLEALIKAVEATIAQFTVDSSLACYQVR